MTTEIPFLNPETLESILNLGTVFTVVFLLLFIGYAFFALFLFLRIRILALTFRNQHSGIVASLSLFHMLAVFVICLILFMISLMV